MFYFLVLQLKGRTCLCWCVGIGMVWQLSASPCSGCTAHAVCFQHVRASRSTKSWGTKHFLLWLHLMTLLSGCCPGLGGLSSLKGVVGKKKIAQNLFCEVVKDCQATHSSWEPRRKTWCCYNCSGTSHMCYRQCTPGLLLSQVICSSHPSNFAHLHTPLISSVAMQCFFDLSIIFWPKVCWCWDLTGMNAVPFKIT